MPSCAFICGRKEVFYLFNDLKILSPFTKEYWLQSARNFKNIKILTVCAMMLALTVVLTMFVDIPIPISDNLRIRFDFLAEIILAMVGGPLIAIAGGALGDLIGFALHPSGAFFPGYTLSAALGCFIYAICFFSSNINLVRILIARLIVNGGVNILLGSVWSVCIGKHGYIYYVAKSLIKNSIMYPIECAMIYLLLLALVPILVRFCLIPAQKRKIVAII